jgi:small-conductance mechanosensitive channel
MLTDVVRLLAGYLALSLFLATSLSLSGCLLATWLSLSAARLLAGYLAAGMLQTSCSLEHAAM